MTKRNKTPTAKRQRLKLKGQWIAHPVGLIHVLSELSLTARRILDTLEIEHCRRGGRENGKLVCTYDDLENSGIDRTYIRKALDKLIASGLIEITRVGQRAYADLRSPTLYRLTYLPTFESGKWIEPTHEWKKQKASAESATGTSGGSATDNGQKPVAEAPPQEGKASAECATAIYILGVEGGGFAADEYGLPAMPPSPSEGAGLNAPPPTQQLPSATAPSSGRLH
jgi:hypothetical protein